MQQKTLHSILIILVFLIAIYANSILGMFVDISISSIQLNLLVFYAYWVIPVVITLAWLYGFKNILKELGLNKGFLWGILFAGVSVLPMFISSAFIGKINNDIIIINLLHKTLFAGFFEEILFRGFLFGILFRKLKWGFIPASILGAIVFGLAHLYQGNSTLECIGIFLTTFVGAAWFSWLFIEWKNNLWIPIFLHIFMNLSWVLFDVGENAMGDTYTNVFRAISIAITVVATIIFNKKKDYFRINKKNLIWG